MINSKLLHIFCMCFLGQAKPSQLSKLIFLDKIVLRESSVQYVQTIGETLSLIGVINIPLGMLMNKLSLSFFSVGLLQARRAWHIMAVTMTDIDPIVTKRSVFRVFVHGCGKCVSGPLRNFYKYHFVQSRLGSVIVHGLLVQLVVVEANVEMQRLAAEEPRSVVVDFIQLVDFLKLFK